MIYDIVGLQKLVLSGETDWEQYGHVKAIEHNDLVLFSYTQEAVFTHRWNFFETISRGLIIKRSTGEVVARPFDKFWNYSGLFGHDDSNLREVTEKLDGSLGIMYREDGKCKVATRKSFDGDQALWATIELQKYDLSDLPEDLTLLFEIIYPDNKIIVDYSGLEALVLIGVREKHWGRDFWKAEIDVVAERYGFETAKSFNMSVQDCVYEAETLDANEEGWVMRFSDGTRYKVKGDAYLKVQKFISRFNPKRILAAIKEDKLDEMLQHCPSDYLSAVLDIRYEAEERIDQVYYDVALVYRNAPKDTRKEFAKWVKGNHPRYASYLFGMHDSRDIIPMIWRNEFGV